MHRPDTRTYLVTGGAGFIGSHLADALLAEGIERDAVADRLRAGGIQTSVHYPPIHRFDWYQRTFGMVSLPYTEQFCARELTLPLHPRLDCADIARVVHSLGEALAATTRTS